MGESHGTAKVLSDTLQRLAQRVNCLTTHSVQLLAEWHLFKKKLKWKQTVTFPS